MRTKKPTCTHPENSTIQKPDFAHAAHSGFFFALFFMFFSEHILITRCFHLYFHYYKYSNMCAMCMVRTLLHALQALVPLRYRALCANVQVFVVKGKIPIKYLYSIIINV